jgi:tripartite-type tricarboxylate transporter receptor subunit TctC
MRIKAQVTRHKSQGFGLYFCLVTFAFCLGCADKILAQPYPSRPVRFVVNASPGGAPDLLARALGQKLTESLGQQFIVDARQSAGGIISGEIAAKAAPDGHTVLLAGAALFGALPATRSRLPFHPFKDFAPITLAAESPNILTIHPGLPAKTVPQLIDLARSKPLHFASAGPLTPAHLAGELFNTMAATRMTHVPYKGSVPALIDLIAGQVQVFITAPISALPHVQAGRVRALATTGARRAAALPDLPTVGETLPGYELTQWWGVVVPAKTPNAIQEKLHGEIVKALRAPDLRERFASQGATTVGNTPREFAAYMQAEFARTVAIVKQAKITVE